MNTLMTHLECSRCGEALDPGEPHGLCGCGGPLLARYDLDLARETLTRERLSARRPDLWRYQEVLPVKDDRFRISLGEGGTPLLAARRLGTELGLSHLYIKDESLNPTGSFKARGLSVAVSMAAQLGIRELAIPSAGNAGGALAAYAAAAGIAAHVVVPRDVPRANAIEAAAYGAELCYVEGLITEAGRLVADRASKSGWFDVSTLKEPYRLEGKKTMGYELFEQLGGRLPDVILYPTGGGTGLVGMWKAFAEMEQLGWIGGKRPRMVSVQSTGCAPIVRAFEQGLETAPPWENASTVASGLRVPRAIGDFLILSVLRESGGTALAVSDAELMRGVRRLATTEGIFAAPEGGACVRALEKLVEQGWVAEEDDIVLFNTGTGLKYMEAMEAF